MISDLELDRVNYLIGSEGDFLEQRYYSTPEPRVGSNGYLYKAGHAMLKGQLYLFGGDYDFRRVRLILSKILNREMKGEHSGWMRVCRF